MKKPNLQALVRLLIRVKVEKGQAKRLQATAADYNRFSDTVGELYRALDQLTIGDLEQLGN